MASKQYRDKDIYQPDIFDNFIKSTKEAIDTTDNLDKAVMEVNKSFAKLGKDLDKQLESIKIDEKSLESFAKLTKLEEEARKGKETLIKVNKEEQKIRKQLIASTDEEVKGKLRLQKANREQKKQLERELILREQLGKEIKSNADVVANLEAIERKEIRTKQEALDQNKALRQIILGLDTTIEEEADAILRLNAVIDKNTNFIKENSDENVKNKINIGNYKESVKEALEETGFLSEATKGLNDIQGRLGAIVKLTSKAWNNYAKQQGEVKDSVDNTGKSVGKLGRIIKTSIIGLLIAGITAVVGFFSSSQEGAIALEKKTEALSVTLKVFFNRVVTFGKGVFLLFVALFNQFSKFGKQIDLISAKIDKAISFRPASIKKAEQNIKRLEGELKKLEEVTFEDAFSNIADAFKGGLFDEIANAVDKSNALVESQFQFANASRLASTEIAKARAEEERLRTILDDDTRGFIERQKASAELSKIFNEDASSFALQNKLAEEQLKIAQDRLLLALDLSGIESEEFERRAKAGEDLSKIVLESQKLRGIGGALTIGTEELDQLVEAEKNAVETSLELQQVRLDDRQKQRKLLFDEVEQEVDFLIDATDTIKTSNEQIINSERETFEARQKALDDTITLLAESNRKVFDELAKTVKGISGQDIFEEFSEATDPSDLNKRLKELGLAEIPIKRLLELFKETKAQERDIKDAREILDDALFGAGETRERIAFLKQQNIAVEQLASNLRLLGEVDISGFSTKELKKFTDELENLNEVTEKRDKKRAIDEQKFAIQQLKERIENEKEGSQARLDLELELAEKKEELLRAETDFRKDEIEKQIEARQKQIDKEKEQLEQLFDFAKKITSEIGKELQKQSDERIKSIDDEISAREKALQRQEQLASEGLENEAEREQERINELQKQRKEALIRQQRQQEAVRLAEIYLSSFEARLQENPETAPAKALVDTFLARGVARGFVQLIGGFKDGVEDLDGKGTETSDSNLALLSKGESVITARGTRENRGLATAMNTGNVDEWVNKHYGNVRGDLFQQRESSMDLVNEVKGLRKDIQNLPTSDLNGDKVGNIIQTIRVGGQKRIIKHKIKPVQ